MDAKKPPMLWRRWGRNEAGKEQLACAHSAGTAREPQEQSCRDCAFLRTVRLPSGRVRRLCALTGSRNPAAPCPHFRPGKEETTRAEAADRPRQSLVCRACAHGIVPHLRAALRGLVGCMAGHIVDGAAWPGLCPDFRAVRTARGDAHAA